MPVPARIVVNIIVNLIANLIVNLIVNLVVNLVVNTLRKAEDSMPRDIMSSEPRHWMVFGQLVMTVQCCAGAPAATAAVKWVEHPIAHKFEVVFEERDLRKSWNLI